MALNKNKIKPFTEWLKSRDPELHEVATSTASIAVFARPIMGLVRRIEKKSKKNKKNKED